MRLLLIFLFLPLLGVAVEASQIDTLRTYRQNGGMYHYTNPTIILQAARFELKHPSLLKTITVTLGGYPSHGGAVVHIYGNEGGLSIPIQERDLIQPIRLRKSLSGNEQITVELPEHLRVNSSQFFVGISDLDSGITLLTDRVERQPVCYSPESGSYYYQALKLKNGEWQYGSFAYRIDVEIAFEEHESVFNHDTTTVQFNNGTVVRPFPINNIACADLDDDSYLDVVANGRLYFNNKGVFKESTQDVKLPATAIAHVLLDINKDGRTDILFFGGFEKSGAMVYINDGGRVFHPYSIDIPPITHITSISIADINNDGHLDLFIGQSTGTDTTPATNKLLLNTGSFSFEDVSNRLSKSIIESDACRASSFVDYNNDGFADLYIANYYNQPDELWINKGNGIFSMSMYKAELGEDNISLNTTGCHWADIDQDGDMDALLPFYAHPHTEATNGGGSANILINNQVNKGIVGNASASLNKKFVYEEKYSGGAWGDINNDGLLDCIVATSCPCRYADVYLQDFSNNFTLADQDLGFSGLAGITDAIWADINNDGSLDLLVVYNDSLVVYKQKKNSGNYVQLDLQAHTGNSSAIGGTVEVYADGKTSMYQVIAGRGCLMQDPSRIHIGIGTVDKIDSILVQWPGVSKKERFNGVSINSITKLIEGMGSKHTMVGASISNLTAYPNPSDKDVTIAFEIKIAGLLTIEVVGIQGNTIHQIYRDEVRPGLFKVQWNGTDIHGQKMPSGSYNYRVSLNGQQYFGTITLIY